ncbi:MAG: ribulose 1,5-bisphosphate carboxylase [Deltaproteobacteria bacterium]|nr:ribulose 1,5-bisphosphate carboxylase [Deltaproteobacteria bacterium]
MERNVMGKEGFFAKQSELDMEDHLIFEYAFESFVDPEEAAAHLCQEQSTAQWKRVDVDEDLRPRFGAKVIDLKVLETMERSSHPEMGEGEGPAYSCRVKIAHPHANFGPKIPNILTAACGEGAFYCPGISVIKLMDIGFPEPFLEHFEGPKFGVKGLRDMLEVYDRPLFFGVVKPNIGLTPESFTALAYESWMGGLDIAKDDEMLGDVEWSPLSIRSALMGQARRDTERRTGEKKIYLANITDEADRLIELHDMCVKNGVNALMVNVMTVGLSPIRKLRRHTEVPLVAHFDFIAPFTRVPYYGVDSNVIIKLQRMVGFDTIILPGFGSRMKTPDREVLENVEECLKPLGHMKPCLPVPAGSQWAGSTIDIYEKLKTIDFGIVPGRGVFEHPMGPRGGGASLNQAWEAHRNGVSLEEYGETHPELKAAIEAFG